MSNIENNPPTAKDGLLILGILLAFGLVAYFVEDVRPEKPKQVAPPDTIRVVIDRPTVIIIE